MRGLHYIIILICLFFPIKHFEAFHLLLIAFTGTLLILQKKFLLKDTVKVFIGLILFIWVSNFLRSIFFTGYNLRDYIEVIRFIPMVLLLSGGFKFKYAIVSKIFLIYVIIDLFVSLFQFLGSGLGDALTSLYGSPFHIDASLGISSRALGLSSGPGQHGSIMTFFYIFFLFSFIYLDRGKVLYFFGVVSTLIAVLLSQSQTSFISVVLISGFMIVYTLVKGNSIQRKYSMVTLGLLLVSGTAFFIIFFDELRYLYTLVEFGLERNSFQRRVGKTDFVWGLAKDNPELLLIGYGKDFFGSLSTAMDNEYLYIFFIYGFIIGIIFLLVILIFLFKVFFLGNLFPVQYLMIGYSFLVGLIFAYPTSFFTEPRLLLLLTLYFLLDLTGVNTKTLLTFDKE
ncbi:hypothetical protein KIH41_16340 [Litoribacter ruber]|uniref:hypothetical protein n=1 Tax=Litoribacter ruber TaxID=702568 RepID=UPI001BDA97DF|nr:hypothetical protein [Litoribacter ruber]MBT0812857.1 hypothetical protein [Litoribacter ruber]